ncbi:MAG: nucleotidyltransferase family protein [Chloroflexota bacterium]
MITAIILAAGQSKRMGKPKMLLPWGDITIIEHVISVFANAGIEDILVVTGGVREQVEAVIRECQNKYPVRSAYNDKHIEGDMLSSIQCGLRNLTEERIGAAMIGLGDQPQIQERSVRLLCEAYWQTQSPLVVPSFQMRRGHPWLVARTLWNELIEINSTQTPRDFLNAHANDIQYVEMDTPSILADLDTPEDYRTARPQNP